MTAEKVRPAGSFVDAQMGPLISKVVRFPNCHDPRAPASLSAS